MSVSQTSPTTRAAWVPAVMAPFAALAVALLLRGQGPALAAGLYRGVLWGSALAAALTVLLVVAARRRTRSNGRRLWRAVAVGALLVLLTSTAQLLPAVDPALERRWQGKLLDLAWLSILFLVLRRWAREEAGLRWRLHPGSARPALALVAGTFAVFAALSVVSVAAGWMPPGGVDAGQVAYDATIPNLTEELLWRGALLAVLDRALGTTAGGRTIGAGVVIAAAVFGLGHGLSLTEQLSWEVNVAGGLFAAAMGLALGWVRVRTGSVWPAFLLHCAPELGVSLGVLAAS